jgi:hypothetical protein
VQPCNGPFNALASFSHFLIVLFFSDVFPAAAKQTLLAFFNFLSSGTTKSYEQCCELADPVAFCVTLPALPNHQPSTGSANRTWEDLRAFQNAALPAQLQTFLQERFKGFDWSGGDLSAAAAVRESGSSGKDSEQASGGFSNHGASPPRDLWSGLQVEVQFEVMEADIVTEGLATMCRFLLQVRVTQMNQIFIALKYEILCSSFNSGD